MTAPRVRGNGRRFPALALLGLLGLALAALQPLAAQQAPAERMDQLEIELRWIERLLELPPTSSEEIKSLTTRLQAAQRVAREVGEAARAEAERVRQLLAALGPPPEEAAEAPDVARRRAELEAALRQHEAVGKRSDLARRQSVELFERVAALANRLAARDLLTRGSSLLDPASWRQAIRQAGTLGEWAALNLGGVGLGSVDAAGLVVGLAVLAAFVVAMVVARRSLLSAQQSRFPIAAGGRAARFMTAIIRITVDGVLPAAVLLAVPLVLAHTFAPSPAFDLIRAILTGAAGLMVAGVALAAIFDPGRPERRLVQVRSRDAHRLTHTLAALLGIAGCAFVLHELERSGPPALDLYHILQFLLRLAIAGLILLVGPRLVRMRRAERSRLSPVPFGRGVYQSLFRAVRFLVPALLVINPVLAASGYWHLADWLFFGTLGTISLLVVLWLLHNATREAVALTLLRSRHTPRHAALRRRGLRPTVLSAWAIGSLNLSLLALTVIALFVIWDVPALQLVVWINQLFAAELTVGSVSFSLLDLLSALLVFAAVVLATRLLQRLLERRVLARTRADPGIRQAVRSGINYTGIALAMVVGFAALGLDLSRVVLVIGALSVGIGFALQPIVGNFVSGLVLLLERPVRVGDWVVIGEHEGRIKRIGVRATEIETLQGAAALIPNSDLVTGQITNWTLGNPAACVEIRLEVAAGADPRKVRELLLEIAREHRQVLSFPAPTVQFSELTGVGRTLILYAFASNAPDRYDVESDLRFAIQSRLEQAGIELAVPLHQVTWSGSAPERPAPRLRLSRD